MGYSYTTAYTEPAGGAIANQLSGSPVEYMGGPTVITLYGSADAAGDTFAITGYTGSEPGMAIVPVSPIPVASTAGAVKTNENFIGQFAIPANTRLVMPVTGASGHIGRFLFVVGS